MSPLGYLGVPRVPSTNVTPRVLGTHAMGVLFACKYYWISEFHAVKIL